MPAEDDDQPIDRDRVVAYRLDVDRERLVVLSAPAARPVPPARLTRAESDVLALLMAGLSNGDIAARTGRRPQTIANQIASIYRRLGVSGRSALVALLTAVDDREVEP